MKSNEKGIILIGYSGHAYVIASIFESMGKKIIAYCDQNEKEVNPFNLTYLGKETEEKSLIYLNDNDYFICIGDNKIREKVFDKLINIEKIKIPINAIHKNTTIHHSVNIEKGNVMISANVAINPLAKIARGVICNTGSVIEHECIIEQFAHIAPGTILCGNVKVGASSFIGANSVVKQGVTIGQNVVVGAGSVVLEDIPDNTCVVGNPGKFFKNIN